MRRLRTVAVALMLALVGLLATGPAVATEHVVRMLNFGPNDTVMVFDPPLIRARVGDTVRFVATDELHNAVTIPGMWPAGAAPINGALSKDVVLRVTHPGVYGIQCVPHYIMGMVALVVAGPLPPANLAQARAVQHPEMAQDVFRKLFEQVLSAR
jgi:pseudoazurin